MALLPLSKISDSEEKELTKNDKINSFSLFLLISDDNVHIVVFFFARIHLTAKYINITENYFYKNLH